MVIPSRNPWGIHHPHRQPARRKEKWEGGRANGGAKWEAIGGRQRENVCFCACLHACPPVFCVCAEIWGIYGSRVEMRRRVVCVCESVKEERGSFQSCQASPASSREQKEASRCRRLSAWQTLQFGAFSGSSLDISCYHPFTPQHTHTQIQQNNCQTVLKLVKNYFGAAVLE